MKRKKLVEVGSVKKSQDCAGFLDDGIINHFLVRNVSIKERFEKVACL